MDQMTALGNATRIKIFEILSNQPSSVSDIAQHFSITRPAVSQHLRVLKNADLVTLKKEGTKNIYYLNPKGIVVLREHLDSLWLNALHNFKEEAEYSAPHRKERSE